MDFARVERPVKGGCVFLVRLKVGGEVRGVVTDLRRICKSKVNSERGMNENEKGGTITTCLCCCSDPRAPAPEIIYSMEFNDD